MTPTPLRTAAITAIRAIHPDEMTDEDLADAVIAATLDQVLETMRQRHYPRPWTFQTNECMDKHWDFDYEDERHSEIDCYRDGFLCNGCGSETCRELPAILALAGQS